MELRVDSCNLIILFKFLKISGTDGIGFAPSLDPNSSLTLFEDKFMRNINYIRNESLDPQNTNYNLYAYTIDSTNFEINYIYNTYLEGFINISAINSSPILVSYPYLSGGNLFSKFNN